MFAGVALSALIAVHGNPVAQKSVEPMQIVVEIGAEATVTLDLPVKRVSVHNPAVAQVRTGAGSAFVRGLSTGRTLVVIWTESGRQIIVVRVEPGSAEQVNDLFAAQQASGGATLFSYNAQMTGTGTF